MLGLLDGPCRDPHAVAAALPSMDTMAVVAAATLVVMDNCLLPSPIIVHSIGHYSRLLTLRPLAPTLKRTGPCYNPVTEEPLIHTSGPPSMATR